MILETQAHAPTKSWTESVAALNLRVNYAKRDAKRILALEAIETRVALIAVPDSRW